jgi:hypothetical protein
MEPKQPLASWWERNWKWFVPAGCFALLLLSAAAVAGLLGVVSQAMRSSDAYRLALESARDDCGLQGELGAPIRPGWFVSGSVNVSGPAGDADLAIPLRGAAAKGTLYVVAEKSAGRWTFERLEVEVAGRADRVDLRDASRPRCPGGGGPPPG